jgi:hypothetical protein
MFYVGALRALKVLRRFALKIFAGETFRREDFIDILYWLGC